MARIFSAYVPGSSFVRGKPYRPRSSLTTVIVIVDPAFLALTSTPSNAPSSADVTWPVSASDVCASGGGGPAGRTTARTAASRNSKRGVRIDRSWVEGSPARNLAYHTVTDVRDGDFLAGRQVAVGEPVFQDAEPCRRRVRGGESRRQRRGGQARQ